MPYWIAARFADELGLPCDRFERCEGRVSHRGVPYIRFAVGGRLVDVECSKVRWASDGCPPHPLLSSVERELAHAPPLPPPAPASGRLIVGIPARVDRESLRHAPAGGDVSPAQETAIRALEEVG